MRLLDPIPFRLPTDDIQQQLRVRSGSEDAAALGRLLARARQIARPRALYTEAFVEERGEETVRVGSVTFRSRALRRSFDGVERVFPFVATCGHELDEENPAPPDDVVARFWWDAIQERLLDAALAAVTGSFERAFVEASRVLAVQGRLKLPFKNS